MPQISKGDTFVNGQQVTGTRLNQLVDSATLLVGAISEQTPIATNGVVANDEVAINDGGVLKKATVSDILNSGLNSTFGTINGKSGSDLILAPAAGQKVDINAAFEANSINCVGNETVGGNLSVTGTTTLTGTTTANGAVNVTGLANFTGGLQINGVSASFGSFLGIIEEDIPNALGTTANTLHNLFTSASYTKPSGELWVAEIDALLFSDNNANIHYRITDSADSINYVIAYYVANNAVHAFPIMHRFYLNSANTHSGTFVFRVKSAATNIRISPTAAQITTNFPDNTKGSIGKFRIYKYKT